MKQFLIPSRRERPGNDPIFALNAEAKERAAKGEDVVNATIGALLEDDGTLAVMPSVVEALGSLPPRTAAAYAPIPGPADFRQAVIDDLLAPYGLGAIATGVATPGGTGALRMALDNFLEPGQALLTSSYFWGPYATLADESGHRLETFNMFGADGRLDTADLDDKLGAIVARQGRALCILNTPCHNPTGYSFDQGEWDAILAAVERHGQAAPIAVLLDVAYGYYQPDGMKLCLDNMARMKDLALVLFAWSASKSFLQYGLRVGSLIALCSDEDERRRITNALGYSCRGIWSNCNAGGMAAITKVLTDPGLRERARSERDELVAMLAHRVALWNRLAGGAGIRFPRYDGGFFTTVFCDDPPGVAARLREQGIFLVPVRGALRVAMCAVNEQQIARIVDGLVRALQG